MIHPPRLCEEKRMIIAQLKDLLLVKCGYYAIDGFTMSNIDALKSKKALTWRKGSENAAKRRPCN